MVRVFGHWLSAGTLLRLLFDLTLLCLATLAVFWFAWGNQSDATAAFPYALLLLHGLVAICVLFGLYRGGVTQSVFRTPAIGILGLVLAVPMAYGMFSPMPRPGVWGDPITLSLLLSLAVMVILRAQFFSGGLTPLLARRVMVVGTGAAAASVGQAISQSEKHVSLVGFYPVCADGQTLVAHERILAEGSSLVDAVRTHKVDQIVVAVQDRRGDAVWLPELLECRVAGVGVLDLSSYFEQVLGQIRLDSLRASWLIFGEGFRQGPVRNVVKRAFDLGAAAMLLMLLWPFMALGALLIALESGLPIFYRQERVGQGGRPFQLIKFRSMRTDAERDGTPRWATRDDPRITRVGRILRKLRIDELPQLYNVLTGDMSLCGPRPERPFFVTYLTREIPFYASRHSVKPGLTGWAQVCYRYGESVDDAMHKLQYDLYYLKNHTLFLDTVILFKTVGVVLTGAGAR